MMLNAETAINWMSARAGKVAYSMTHRNGPGSYDCSSSVYYALMSAGAITAGWAVNTEYMHDWLIKNGYKLIAENQDWEARRGDVFIWGRRGQSSGSGGHTGIFIDSQNIIHCNYANNGITVNDYNQTAAASGWMYCYVYRLEQQEVVNQVSSNQFIEEKKEEEENMFFVQLEEDLNDKRKKGQIYLFNPAARTHKLLSGDEFNSAKEFFPNAKIHKATKKVNYLATAASSLGSTEIR